MHGYQVASYQNRTYRKEDPSCRKPEFQTEQDGEDERHTYERSISGHHDVFLDTAKGA